MNFVAQVCDSSVKRSACEYACHGACRDVGEQLWEWPIWMHLQGPGSWMLQASSARWVFTCFGKHFPFRGHISCMWVGNNEKWLYNIWFIPVLHVCVCVCVFDASLRVMLCRSMCVGSAWCWLDVVSYTLLWGAVALRTMPAAKQQQPYREPFINHIQPSYFHSAVLLSAEDQSNCLTKFNFCAQNRNTEFVFFFFFLPNEPFSS